MREYVEKMLHTRVDSMPIDASKLSLYLKGLYSLERWTAFGVPFIVARSLENPAVKTMAKHRNALEKALEMPVAFALEDATSYRAGRMIEAGLPFVVPSKQVYLPFLGIALADGKGRAHDRPQASVETFSPQAQRLALMAIYGNLDGVCVTQAAEKLGTAKMSASRAFDELAAVDSSLVATEGRRRVLRPGTDKLALWRRLESHMSSPVAMEYHLERMPNADLPLGGISALCELSMLQDNPWTTFAATKRQERDLRLASNTRYTSVDALDDPVCVVQVLRYDPIPRSGHVIDPLSAILSLTDDERDDPRVMGQIEDVIERALGGKDTGNR